MNNKIIVGVAAAVIAVLGFVFTQQAPVVDTLGSASSPSVNGGCMEVEGITRCYKTSAMAQASTTCSFRSPTQASSTLVSAVGRITNAQGGAFDVEWGKAVATQATTTSLGRALIAAATGQATAVASTSPVQTLAAGTSMVDSAGVFAPGTWVNMKIGSTSVSSSFRGTCAATFEVF